MAEYLRLAEADTTATYLSQGQVGEIVRDVVRTFPGHPFFKSGCAGERMLGRVLQAVAAANPKIGYCQGMNFVCGGLILGRLPVAITGGIPNSGGTSGQQQQQQQQQQQRPQQILDEKARLQAECDCFTFLLSLMNKGSKLPMLGLWQAGVPKMKLRVYQLDRLLRWTLPKLHTHFESIQLAPEILVAQWFITIFSYTVPLSLTLRLWDSLFLGGWPAMYRVALALLSALEQQLLGLDLEGIGFLMRDWKRGDGLQPTSDYGPERVLRMASTASTNVTAEVLGRLQENFALEMISLCESSSSAPTSNNDSTDGSTDATPSSALGTTFAAAVSAAVSTASNRDGGNKRRSTLSLEHCQWLSRYGEELSGETAADLLRVRDELRSLETETEADKQHIQAKLLRACDNCRAAETALREASAQRVARQDEKEMLAELLEAVTLKAIQISNVINDIDVGGDEAKRTREGGEGRGETEEEEEEEEEDDDDDEEEGGRDSDEEGSEGNGSGSSPQTSTQKQQAMQATAAADSPRRRVRRAPGEGATASSSFVVTEGLEESRFSRRLSLTMPNWLSKMTRPTTVVMVEPLQTEEQFPPSPVNSDSVAPPSPQSKSWRAIELMDIGGGGSGDINGTRNRSFSASSSSAAARPSTTASTSSTPLAAIKALGSKINKSLGRAFRRGGRAKKGGAFHAGGFLDPQQPPPRSRLDIEQSSQLCQRRIIAIQRKLTQARSALSEAVAYESVAHVELEEAKERKRCLCDQLQLLVEESQRARGARLSEVAEKYSV